MEYFICTISTFQISEYLQKSRILIETKFCLLLTFRNLDFPKINLTASVWCPLLLNFIPAKYLVWKELSYWKIKEMADNPSWRRGVGAWALCPTCQSRLYCRTGTLNSEHPFHRNKERVPVRLIFFLVANISLHVLCWNVTGHVTI